MKVKDLIEMLQKLNPEAEIVEPEKNMVLKQSLGYYEDKGWVDETEEILNKKKTI
jgi:hypothetical protein